MSPDTAKKSLVSKIQALRTQIKNILKLLYHVSILLICHNFCPEKQ